MKIIEKTIPIYEFNFTMVLFENPLLNDIETNEFINLLSNKGIDISFTEDIICKMSQGNKNGGDTFYNEATSQFIVIIYPQTSKAKLLNTLMHEKRHVEDLIIKSCEINDDESEGYLAGHLSEYFLTDNIINYFKF